jgi:tRNA splicing ligase
MQQRGRLIKRTQHSVILSDRANHAYSMIQYIEDALLIFMGIDDWGNAFQKTSECHVSICVALAGIFL